MIGTVEVKVLSSEPRDVGQLERTYLLTVKLCGFLMFSALGVLLHFKMNTSEQETRPIESGFTFKNKVMSFLLLVVCLGSIIVNSINYSHCITHYKNREILTSNYNFLSVGLMTCIIVLLVGINVVFLIEGYQT